MARKSKDAYDEEMAVPDLEPKVKADICNHINRQSIGTDGKPDNCSCFLPKGHSGPHKGKHLQQLHTHIIKDRRIVGEGQEKIETVAEWWDGAGIPFNETPVPAEIPPKSLAELDFGINAANVMKGV